MGIIVTTDVFCDKCSNWGHHHGGQRSDKKGAMEAAMKDGWTKVKVDGDVDLHCPACNGSRPEYWCSWFREECYLGH